MEANIEGFSSYLKRFEDVQFAYNSPQSNYGACSALRGNNARAGDLQSAFASLKTDLIKRYSNE